MYLLVLLPALSFYMLLFSLHFVDIFSISVMLNEMIDLSVIIMPTHSRHRQFFIPALAVVSEGKQLI